MNALVHINQETWLPLNNDQLKDQITELAANINAANYQLLVLIAEIDRRRAWGDWGTRSCAHWLNWKCGIAMGAAREKVRVALALTELPKVSAAFASGQLSYSKARAITRVANHHNEDYLLMIAEHGSASHVEKLVSHYRCVEQTGEREKARKEEREKNQLQHAQRELHYHWDDDGNLVIRATLPAEQGAVVLKALQSAVATLESDDWHSEPEMPVGDKSVSAETDFLPEGVPIPEKPERRANRRADVLSLIAENHLNNVHTITKTADRYQVIVHADAELLSESGEPPNGTCEHVHCELENGPALSPDTARRLCCDASVTAMLSKQGEPVSIGRKSRTIPPPMRRALLTRDSGCRFPGCNATRFVDGHHIEHWADGGETSLENLTLLCRHHHRLVHDGGYGLSKVESEAIKKPVGIHRSSLTKHASRRPYGPRFGTLSREANFVTNPPILSSSSAGQAFCGL